MAITSANKSASLPRYGTTQFRYSVTYVIITLVVLMVLNVYCSKTTQTIFYHGKESSMVEKCLLTTAEISNLEVLNNTNITEVLADLESLKVTRLIVTDHSGIAIYDSSDNGVAVGQYVLLPEVVQALDGNDTFTWRYHNGVVHSQVATPIISYGKLTGCVYMMEYDSQQGALIQSLQLNILSITLVLELVVIVFSSVFSTAFSTRMRQILHSMSIIREGDYTHKVDLKGHDELTVLGREFNDLTDRLHTSESKRRQFVSDASHELKTPLASIKLLTDSILMNDMDQQTVKEFVEDIGREADRLTRMSSKLLSLSRIESQEDGDCEIIYMTPTVERVLRMLRPIAQKSNIRIQTDLSGDCPILVLEDDLYEIAFNLVENAIKYNLPEGTLTIALHRSEDNAVLKVSDTGMGIPPESIGHIFDRFYRVDKARSRKTGGSGLGLSIVRNIVERNGGTIMVESAVGVGTTFTVEFPAFDPEEVSQ